MKLAKKILLMYEKRKEHKDISYEVKKRGSKFFAEIEGEEIEDTESRSEKEAESKAKKYIDQVL